MYYTVDRIEGGFAVLEDGDGNVTDVSVKDLPENIKESDIVKFENCSYRIDEERTNQVKKILEERFKRLFLN